MRKEEVKIRNSNNVDLNTILVNTQLSLLVSRQMMRAEGMVLAISVHQGTSNCNLKALLLFPPSLEKARTGKLDLLLVRCPLINMPSSLAFLPAPSDSEGFYRRLCC